ncbi:MAG: hypothetical protein GEU78_10090 [Actinobacteria bacterium]|nr:hypothetical protein [Actinomycetota bacterium]
MEDRHPWLGAVLAFGVLVLPGCEEPSLRPEVVWEGPAAEVVSIKEWDHRSSYNTGSDVDRSGRLVAFVASVKDGPEGVYLRDMERSVSRRIDVWYTGDQPAPGTRADQQMHELGSGSPSVSAAGRHIAFVSNSPYLVPNDTNRKGDVFVYDHAHGSLRMVSTNGEGLQANGDSRYPSISGDGRFVAFASRAGNLVEGSTHAMDVYLKDRRTGRIALISRGLEGRRRGGIESLQISDDGSTIAFASDASDLVPDDTNRAQDVFVWERGHGVERVSLTSEGDQLVPFEYEESGGSFRDGADSVALSGDGDVVAFATHANGLVPEDQNDNVDVYVRDLASGTIERVSEPSGGGDAYPDSRECGNNGQCFTFIASHSPSLSFDGRYVSFVSGAPGLEIEDRDDPQGTDEDVFVHDRETDVTMLVHRTARGLPARAANIYPGTISGDGRSVTFGTDALLFGKRPTASENGHVYLQRLPRRFRLADSG